MLAFSFAAGVVLQGDLSTTGHLGQGHVGSGAFTTSSRFNALLLAAAEHGEKDDQQRATTRTGRNDDDGSSGHARVTGASRSRRNLGESTHSATARVGLANDSISSPTRASSVGGSDDIGSHPSARGCVEAAANRRAK